MEKNVTTRTEIDLPLFIKGKVRDVYDLGEQLLIVSSDRISAFDVVLPNVIPDKGKILNQISVYWFTLMKRFMKNHLITAKVEEYPEDLQKYRDQLVGRSMLVRKTQRIPVECVVRRYLAGSAWEEYQKNGTVSGVPMRPGLKESERLPNPIFTPTTKGEGVEHDRMIQASELRTRYPRDTCHLLDSLSISTFNFASQFMPQKNLILADTKFEYGFLKDADGNDTMLLIDECLTPDSSRFWEEKEYKVGISPPSFDKQFVRDYLNSVGWNRQPPVPTLPEKIVQKTREKYMELFRRITGQKELEE